MKVRKEARSCQTEVPHAQELDALKHEMLLLNHQVQEHELEKEQLRDAMKRYIGDIDRLIDEKRTLELEIEEKNLSRIQHAQNSTNENINISKYEGLRNRSNSPNNSMGIRSFANHGRSQETNASQVQLILQEKENYIAKLNTELNELRAENEKLKDKLILYELDNLGQTNPGARTFKSSHLKNQNTMHSNQEKTLADSRSIISQTYNLDKHRARGGRYDSNFDNTGGYNNYLSVQDQARGSLERSQNSIRQSNQGRLISPQRVEQQFMTQNIQLDQTPMLGHQHHPVSSATKRDENQFYTLQQTQQLSDEAFSNRQLAPYMAANSGSTQNLRDSSLSPHHRVPP